MRTEKHQLRTLIRAQLRSLSVNEIEDRSHQICAHLKVEILGILKEGDGIALFGGLQGEPDLVPLLPWMAKKGLRSYFFGMCENELVPCEIKDSCKLKRGRMGVWEPPSLQHRLEDVGQLSVVLTPGLAFDPKNGARLGRGAGFYDRFFSNPRLTALRVGVAFECQMRDDIPTEPHDIRIDSCVTERGFRKI
jgi:5-formyltetrahydrofolate cyclo-ligase